MLLIILIGIVCILAFIKYKTYFKGYENVDSTMPGPKPWPIVGNALLFLGDSHHAYKVGLQLMLEYRYARFWLGPILYMMIANPEDNEIILSSTTLIEKLDVYNYFTPWIGRGLLTAFGSRWKKNRKALTPAFHFKILDGFLDVFNRNTQDLLKLLENEIGNKSFDVVRYIKLCALDNICETAMGIKIGAQHDPDAEYVQSIKKICHIMFLRSMFPWYRISWLFKLTHYGKEQTKVLKIIHGLSEKVVENRIQTRKETATTDAIDTNNETDENDLGMKKKRAFLDLLLDLVDEGQLTVDDVLQEVNTFMFEGHDTVTSAVGFALYSLSNSPEYQEKAYKEQEQIFGNDDRVPTSQDLQEMRYMEMVIKETMRLYPSVPIMGRVATEDVKLSDGNVIPMGCNIIVGVMAVHRKPEIWEKPNEFYPDHFLPEACLKRHPFAYIPFSAGPRNCIGMKFAMMEMKTMISQIIRRYKLIPASPQIPLRNAIEMVLISKTGFPVALLSRK